MNDIIFKTLLLKGEAGGNIKDIKKTSTDGLVDTYTVTLTDGDITTFTVTNGKSIVDIKKIGSTGLVDNYKIDYNDGTSQNYTVTNGKDGELTNIDDTLSTTSTNPIQNKAVATEINTLNINVNSLSEFPKFYNSSRISPVSGDVVHLNGTNYTDIGVTDKVIDAGLYMVNYDVFLLSSSTENNSCEVQLHTGAFPKNLTSPHYLVAPKFGNLAFGINVSYTDFIELDAPSKLKIIARNRSGSCALKLCDNIDGGGYYKTTILKLR